jgi:glucose dehydrogenase
MEKEKYDRENASVPAMSLDFDEQFGSFQSHTEEHEEREEVVSEKREPLTVECNAVEKCDNLPVVSALSGSLNKHDLTGSQYLWFFVRRAHHLLRL